MPSWGSFYGGTGEVDFSGFVNDASAGGTNDHLNGDYHLINDNNGDNHYADVPRLPGKECAYDVDINGAPILLNGTAIAGALQPHTDLLSTLDPSADYDGDSLTTIVEYVLGADATRRTTPSDLYEIFYRTSTPVDGNPYYLGIRYQQRKGLDNITSVLMVSENFSSWVPAATLGNVIADDGLFETIEWLHPLGSSDEYFIRFQVTTP